MDKSASLQLNNLEAIAKSHLLTPSEDMTKIGVEAHPLIMSGEGIYVYNSAGRRLIDGPAGMWCTQIGYGRREIADALSRQAMELSYNSPWYTTNSPATELAARIAQYTPGDLNRVFFTTGGSTAVDSALRFVEFYNNVLGRPEKKHIIVQIDGYHGSTKLTASTSGRRGSWPNFDIASERVSFISSPNILSSSLTEADFLEALVEEFKAKIAEIGPDMVATFVAEPLLASGGVVIPPKGYHARFKAICEEHDIVYISDEVVTAFGRCGEWFASEKVFGVVPDIITFAKGVTSGYVPLGGFAISDRLLAKVSGENSRGSTYSNGYTYSGHPVSCAAALANIDVLENENVLQHVRDISGYFEARLRSLLDLPLVADVRTSGLVGCVECIVDKKSYPANALDKRVSGRVDEHCFNLGLIVRPMENMCIISPPLIITKEQIDAIVDIMHEGILRTWSEFENGYFQ